MPRQSREGGAESGFASRLIQALQPEVHADTPTAALSLYVEDGSDLLDEDNCEDVLRSGIELELINPDALDAWRAYLMNSNLSIVERSRPFDFILHRAIEASLSAPQHDIE